MLTFIGDTIIALLIMLYELPRIGKEEIKERWSIVTITVAAWSLLVLVIPNMPGTTQGIEYIYINH